MLTRRCWTADAVGLICFLFGLGFVGAEDDNADVVRVNASLSLVRSGSDDVLSTLTKTNSLWLFLAPPISARWHVLCVDLIGPYTLNGKDGSNIEIMCLTMIDPATSWFEIVELPILQRDHSIERSFFTLLRCFPH